MIALETAGGPLYDIGPYVILPALVDAVPSSGQSEERTGERTWVDVDGENRRRSHHHHLDDVPQAGCDGSIDRELCVQLTKG